MNDSDQEVIRRIQESGGSRVLDIQARPHLIVTHSPGAVVIQQGYPAKSDGVYILGHVLLTPDEARAVHAALEKAIANLSATSVTA